MLPVQAAFQQVSDLPLAFMPSTVRPAARATRAASAIPEPMSALEFTRQCRELLERGPRSSVRRDADARAPAPHGEAARAHSPRLPDPVQRLVGDERRTRFEIGARRSIVTAAEWPARRGETIRAHRGAGREHLLAMLEECGRGGRAHARDPLDAPALRRGFLLSRSPRTACRADRSAARHLRGNPKGVARLSNSLPDVRSSPGCGGRTVPGAALPLARRYGAAVVAACHSGTKIPETAEERLEIAERILAAAVDAGLRQEDLIFDPVVLPARGSAESLREVLRAITMIRERLGTPTMLRLSRVSEDLPARGQLEAGFLAMAAAAGLDLAVIDAASALVHLAMAASLLTAAIRKAGGTRRVPQGGVAAPHGTARHQEPREHEEREPRPRREERGCRASACAARAARSAAHRRGARLAREERGFTRRGARLAR